MSDQMMDQPQQEMTDEDAIIRIANLMKDNAPSPDEKQNVHTFLSGIIQTKDIDKVSKLGNLRNDKDLDELGNPNWNVRGTLDMARISAKIMDNSFFQEYFEAAAGETLNTSLSREGFFIRQGTTQTKQVADITKRRKVNKGWFSTKQEITGGDTSGSAGSQN